MSEANEATTPPDHAWGARGAIDRGGRAVHYRRTGFIGAPVVILLHGSPESASALHAIARALEPEFDVIALDTPGNGLSAPLPVADPVSADYAREVLAIMDVLGVPRAGVYGFHSGAATAMQMALLEPERVAALVLDGYPVWTEAERADLLARYCIVYPPVWDGSHLAQTWARLEEQLRFFPWNTPRLDARMDLPPTPMAVRLRRLRDWLTAWDCYPAPYRAAFKARGEDGPERVAVPTLIGAMGRDPLSAHLARLPELAPDVLSINWGDDRLGAIEQMLAHLVAHPGAEADIADPSDPALLQRLASPVSVPFTPDDHGGFLLQLWSQLRTDAIASANSQAELDAGLDPLTLHQRITAIIQAQTGL